MKRQPDDDDIMQQQKGRISSFCTSSAQVELQKGTAD